MITYLSPLPPLAPWAPFMGKHTKYLDIYAFVQKQNQQDKTASEHPRGWLESFAWTWRSL